MIIDTEIILSRSKNSLLDLVENLKDIEIVPFYSFKLNSIEFRTKQQLESVLNLPKNKFPVVYIIEILDSNSKSNLIDQFSSFSTQNKSKLKNQDRINHSRYNETDSTILYVGSTIKDFRKRLFDHLGLRNSVRTYSLHLSKWDNSIDYSIRISLYEIKYLSNRILERGIVELIEQQIWDQLKPIFGKRSGLL